MNIFYIFIMIFKKILLEKEDVQYEDEVNIETTRINETNQNNWSLLMIAIGNGNLDLVKILLDYDVELDHRDDEGRTVLMACANFGYNELITIFIQKGINLNQKDNNNMTALDYAIENNKTETIKILEEAGAKSSADL